MNTGNRFFALTLVISLMFNAFAVGLLISERFSPPVPFPGFAPAHDPHRADFAHDPDTQHVRELFQELRISKRKEFLPVLKSIRQARHQVQLALAAEPFDPAALENALRAVRVAEQAAAEHAHRTISELAGQLNAAERARLGQMIPRHRRGPRAAAMPVPSFAPAER